MSTWLNHMSSNDPDWVDLRMAELNPNDESMQDIAKKIEIRREQDINYLKEYQNKLENLNNKLDIDLRSERLRRGYY